MRNRRLRRRLSAAGKASSSLRGRASEPSPQEHPQDEDGSPPTGAAPDDANRDGKRPERGGADPRPLSRHPLVRLGAYTWALLGLVVALVGVALVLGELSVIVAPLVLALFPAALLAPPAHWLRRHGLPPAAASLVVIIGGLAVLGGAIGFLTPAIAAELPGVAESVRRGISQLQNYLAAGPFGTDPETIQEAIDRVRAQAASFAQQAAGTIATAIVEGVAGVLLALVALFFYLKDGGRIARWLRDLFPRHLRGDAQVIGVQVWTTVGSYFRGQLLVALIDAVFIGLGLVVLGVPLALPLAVLVFLGGLFPIVGAVVSGAIAVLVALADAGVGVALLVLALVLVVQQVESNVLAPVVLGRATALHPLAVVLAITGGGVVLGVLGAFLAVPVVASLSQTVGYLRARARARQRAISPEASAPAAGP